MTSAVLAVNPGSSSLKAALLVPDRQLTVHVERLGTPDANATVSAPGTADQIRPVPGGLAEALEWVADAVARSGMRPDAVAHRVVHGGPHHDRPAVVDDALLGDLRAAIPLAPLHLPGAIEVITLARRTWPGVPHVACFDTAFHASLPDEARRLPVPDDVAALGVRRYGFHGLAVESVVAAVPDLGRAVVAHLGSGCSVTAVADGRSQHTTMSLTPTSGIVSATRTGDLDPELVLFLLARPEWDVGAVRDMLDHRGGIAAFSGGVVDMRDLLAARSEPAIDLALRAFTRSVAMGIASCVTALDRWDTLAFSGGIGEHSAEIREEICARLGGLVTGSARPGGTAVDRLRDGGVRVIPVTADEESVMSRHTRELLGL